MTRRRPLFLALACVALLALALGLAACGDDDDDSGAAPETTAAATATAPATPTPTETTPTETTTTTGGAAAGASTLALQADPSGALKYVETELTAKPGKITFPLTNESAVPHDVAVEGAEGASEEVTDGASTEFTVDLPAGTYEYYCTVPGHRQAGMVGTLTVK